MFVVRRCKDNPLLLPGSRHPWEAMATMNWCPVLVDGATKVFYRANTYPDELKKENLSWSTIGVADLLQNNFVRNRKQLIKPDTDWDRYGCEDPRVTYFQGKYYILYTALSTCPFTAEGIKVGLAISEDCKTIETKHLITPFNAKAMALFPEPVNGRVAVILTANTDRPPARIAVAMFDKIEDLWSAEKWQSWYEKINEHTLNVARSDSDHVEVGATPLKIDQGWLLVYSHIQHYYEKDKIFGVEALLLDDNDPRKIIARTKSPFMVTQEIYEKIGHVPNIVFPSGALIEEKKLKIFYGAADTVGCTASLPVQGLVNSMYSLHKESKLVRRSIDNPILSSIPEHNWEDKAVFNPAAIDLNGQVYILYRALSKDDTSKIGCAVSKDGINIDERLPEPIYTPREPFETKKRPGNSGCEDPRIVRIEDRLYMTYTAYNGQDVPRVAVSSISVDDFLARRWNWSPPYLISPDYIMDKNTCIIPKVFDGKYLILHRVDDDVCADYVDSLDFKEEKLDSCLQVLQPRSGMWDGLKVGISAPPLQTEEGWLLFYHGVSEAGTYRVSAALLDSDYPAIVLARMALPILEPKMRYEREGLVPNVVFPCGAVRRGDTIYLYYGGADQVVGVATASFSEIINCLLQ